MALFVGAPLGNRGGAPPFTVDFEKKWKEGSGNVAIFSRGLCYGILEMRSLTGDPKACVKEGFGDVHLSVWRLSWATWSGLTYQALCETVE